MVVTVHDSRRKMVSNISTVTLLGTAGIISPPCLGHESITITYKQVILIGQPGHTLTFVRGRQGPLIDSPLVETTTQ